MEPWVQDLSDEVTFTVGDCMSRWVSIVKEMGMEQDDRSKWITIYKKETKTLFEELISDAEVMRNNMMDKIEELLKEAEQLCKDLKIKMPKYGAENLGLGHDLNLLTEKVSELNKTYNMRLNEINDMNKIQKELCCSLGTNTPLIPTKPLPSAEELDQFRLDIERLEHEKFLRDEKYLLLKCKIIDIVRDLGKEPRTDFERSVLANHDNSFIVTNNNMKMLENFHVSLVQELDAAKLEINSLRHNLRQLWNILGRDSRDYDAFILTHNDFSTNTLQALTAQVNECEALKKANIEIFIKNARTEIVKLWDKCLYGNKEREYFVPFHSEHYTEDLLELHQNEVDALQTFHDENSNLIVLINKREDMWMRMLELDERASAPDRLKNRGGYLLKEQKERSTVQKAILKYEDKLLELAAIYEIKNAKKFLCWGQTIEEIINISRAKQDEDKNCKSSARKLQSNVTSSTSAFASIAKRELYTPSIPSKRNKLLRLDINKVPRSAPPKIQLNSHTICKPKLFYSTEKKKRVDKLRRISRMMLLEADKENPEYEFFKTNLSNGQRSTMVRPHLPLIPPTEEQES